MKFIAAILCIVFSMHGAEYIVGPEDSIQNAADKLQAGDILTLRPGFYSPGTVTIRACGTSEKPVTIRGMHRESVILCAWESLDNVKWERTQGERFVYGAKVDFPVWSVADLVHDTILLNAPGRGGMDRFRGTFFFDPEKKMLYCHPVDGNSPGKGLKATVRSGYLFLVQGARNLVIRDMTFCGTAHENPRFSSLAAAIRTIGSENILVENCGFLYNSGGVAFTSTLNGTARNCFFRRNEALGYGEMAQLFWGSGSRNCLAENNIAFNDRNHGIRFYSGASNVTARGNIILNSKIGLYFKATREERCAERNVVLDCKDFNYSDLSGGRPIRDIHNTFGMPSFIFDDNETNLKVKAGSDPRFCAPEFHDFRLQGDSMFFGKGAQPDPAPVFYLAEDGKDSHDGKSERRAFRTFQRAEKELRPGTTLYIQPGNYPTAALTLSGVTIRGRGKNPSATVAGFTFRNSSDCIVENLRIGHLLFEGGKDLRANRIMSGTIRTNSVRNALFYRCEAADADVPGAESISCAFPPRIPEIFPGKLPWCTGASDPIPGENFCPGIDEVKLEACYPEQATLSWITPGVSCSAWRKQGGWWFARPVLSYIEYGETEKPDRKAYSTSDIFHHVNLSGLKPGTRYFFRAVVPKSPLEMAPDGTVRQYSERENAPDSGKNDEFSALSSFVTPTAFQVSPRVIRVEAGDSLREAAKQARPGDTVLLSPGIYHDTLQSFVSGTAGAPITFQAEKTGEAVIDGGNFMLPAGVYMENVAHIRIRGLVIRNCATKSYAGRGGMEYGNVQLIRCSDVELSDCVVSGYSDGGVYQMPLILKNCDRITVRNNVFAGGVHSVEGGFNGSWSFVENTVYGSLIANFSIASQKKGSVVTVRENLFVGLSRQKALAKTDRTSILGTDFTLDLDGNLWYFSPGDKAQYCGFEGHSPKLEYAGLERLRSRFGYEKNGRAITSIRFKGHRFIDFFDTENYRKQVEEPITYGKIIPTLEFFEPDGYPGYGARPVKGKQP